MGVTGRGCVRDGDRRCGRGAGPLRSGTQRWWYAGPGVRSARLHLAPREPPACPPAVSSPRFEPVRTAAAFRAASENTRDRVSQAVANYLKEVVRTERERAERVASFERVADRLGAMAQANGWTDELDAALLRGDFDRDD